MDKGSLLISKGKWSAIPYPKFLEPHEKEFRILQILKGNMVHVYDAALQGGTVYDNQAHTCGVECMNMCTKYLVRCGHEISTSSCQTTTW